MTIQTPAAKAPLLIPDNAPFSADQRAWLNGFFAGLLSLDVLPGATAVAGLPDVAAKALNIAEPDDGAPWHDPAMPIAERMELAEERPVRRKLFAAMAQQNCGQCGYLCESYADKLATGEESRQNLCVPGGKDTARTIKALLQASPVATSAFPVVSVQDPAATPTALHPLQKAGYCREQPVHAVFTSARRLSGERSEKDTRHVVFDISSAGIDYVPGDSFGIFPRNDPALVDAVLAAMKAPGDFPVGGMTFREALLSQYSLGLAPDMLFELASYMVGGSRRIKLKALANGLDPDGDASTFDVLKLLEEFGPLHPDPEAFLESLDPLQPRLYSISSSPAASPGELHLTVDAVRYDIANRRRLGVASTFIADRLCPSDTVQVYVQKAHGFALPADPATPIIMIGPGTGIAPFRSFLWHRFATKASGKAWLFFGHQHEATDYLYQDELARLQDAGALTKLSTAWSRDGAEKVYVQDRLRQEATEVWRWLKQGAHVYVCGDAKRMAKDVETALADVITVEGHLSALAARDYISDLRASGRYQADVY
jgi:sulfite reductase (NADPH) flavoprotein alpha-component